MNSIKSKYSPTQAEASTVIQEHVVTATVNLLQAKLLLARQRHDQQTCLPLLEGRIKAIAPIVDELLRMGGLLRRDALRNARPQ